jgi:hypothetical protein
LTPGVSSAADRVANPANNLRATARSRRIRVKDKYTIVILKPGRHCQLVAPRGSAVLQGDRAFLARNRWGPARSIRALGQGRPDQLGERAVVERGAKIRR